MKDIIKKLPWWWKLNRSHVRVSTIAKFTAKNAGPITLESLQGTVGKFYAISNHKSRHRDFQTK